MGGTYQPSTASSPRLFTLPRGSALWWTLAVLAAIGVGVAIRIWAAWIGGDTADVRQFRDQIEIAVRNHDNIYKSTAFFPYLPGWLYIEEAIWHFSQSWHIEFWWLIHLVVVASDMLTCLAVWWVATITGGATRGRWAAAIYALSPIAIVISGTHGQFDTLPTLFSILAAGCMLSDKKRPWAAGLLLGVAIAIKPPPALLLPAFVLFPQQSWRDRISIMIGACVMPLIVTAPYLLSDFHSVLHQVVGYHGSNDQGLGGVLRAAWLDHAHNLYLPGPMGDEIAKESKFVVLAIVGFVLVALWRQHLARVCAALYLAFLAVYGGISTQYLLWPLAWLLVSDISLKWAVLYAIGTAAGALGFYWVFFPQLISDLPDGTSPVMSHSQDYLAGEIISYVAIVIAFFAAILPGIRLRQWRNPALWITLAATLIAFDPIGKHISTLVHVWPQY